MEKERPDTKGFGEDVTRTPEEVAREKGDPAKAGSSGSDSREKTREEFNLNEADHRRNPHG